MTVTINWQWSIFWISRQIYKGLDKFGLLKQLHNHESLHLETAGDSQYWGIFTKLVSHLVNKIKAEIKKSALSCSRYWQSLAHQCSDLNESFKKPRSCDRGRQSISCYTNRKSSVFKLSWLKSFWLWCKSAIRPLSWPRDTPLLFHNRLPLLSS